MEFLLITLAVILLTLVSTITISKYTKRRILKYIPLFVCLIIIIYCSLTVVSVLYPTSIGDMVKAIVLFIMIPCFIINLIVCFFIDLKYWLSIKKGKKNKSKKEQPKKIKKAGLILSPRELGWRFRQWLVTLFKKKS